MGALTSEYLWFDLLGPPIKMFALAGSLVGIALGVCLIVRTEATLRRMRGINRWVSSRRAMKPFEISRNIEPGTPARRRGIGIVVAAVGMYAFFVLALQLDPGKLASVLGEHSRYSLSALTIDGLRWVLVAGCALAVVIGIMLLFAPHALSTLEAQSNRWISSRQLAAGGDTMHMPLDHLTERHPRVAGAVIAGLSLAAAAASAVLLVK